jgi:malate dehydrogenase (oxaloacetate-decarboxylating)(NADP+)
VEALADLTMAETSDAVSLAYGGQRFRFGPEYLIPKPFDPRLMIIVPPRVAKAAMDSGVATRPIEDFSVYQRKLENFIYQSGMVMRPVFERAMANPRRLIYADGESRRVLRAVQVVIDDGICRPILIGKRSNIASILSELGLSVQMDKDFDILELHDNKDFERDWQLLLDKNQANGMTKEEAKNLVSSNPSVMAAVKVQLGDADGMLCGLNGPFSEHLDNISRVFDLRKSANACSTVHLVILKSGIYFISDTNVAYQPSAEHIVEATSLAADIVRRFGLTPKVALLSHSSMGSSEHPSAKKMRDACRLLKQKAPNLMVEGEMQADAAINESIRQRLFPETKIDGSANLLMMPDLDAANIAYNLLKTIGGGVAVGPILVGFNRSAHILTPSLTVRGIVNMSAVAVVHALDVESEAKAVI